jgi:hypothetical protein
MFHRSPTKSHQDSITSSVGIHQLVGSQSDQRRFPSRHHWHATATILIPAKQPNCGLCRSSDAAETAKANLFFQVVAKTVLGGVGGSLTSPNKVGIFHGSGQLISKEINNKRCRQVQGENLW